MYCLLFCVYHNVCVYTIIRKGYVQGYYIVKKGLYFFNIKYYCMYIFFSVIIICISMLIAFRKGKLCLLRIYVPNNMQYTVVCSSCT